MRRRGDLLTPSYREFLSEFDRWSPDELRRLATAICILAGMARRRLDERLAENRLKRPER